MNINRILCPIDLSETSRRAVDQAVAFAGWYKARIAVLHVLSPMPVVAANLAMVGGQSIDRDIEAVRADVAAHCEAVVSADLIVIGAHGHNPVALGVFGSTASQLVRRATCPVMTVR